MTKNTWDVSPPDFDDDWMFKTICKALIFYADMWAPMSAVERNQIIDLAEMYSYISHTKKERRQITDALAHWSLEEGGE